MRVLHLTDPHLFADRSDSLRGTVTYNSLEAVLDHYERSDWRADLAAVTGDLVQDDSAGAYGHFGDLLRRLRLPVHCVPGNHDVRAIMQDQLGAPPFFYCDTVETGNWLIVGLDSCIADRAGGSIGERELDRFDAAVASSDADHVMICLHHPPVAMGSRWLDSVGLDNADRFMDRVAACERARLVVFGHVHQDYDREHDGLRVIATPSTCRQFKPGSDEFSVDDRPPAYRRIELSANGQVKQELVWLPA